MPSTTEGPPALLVKQHVRAALNVADRGYVLSHGTVVGQGCSAELTLDAEILASACFDAGKTEELSV